MAHLDLIDLATVNLIYLGNRWTRQMNIRHRDAMPCSRKRGRKHTHVRVQSTTWGRKVEDVHL
jgi:hypothetical protein